MKAQIEIGFKDRAVRRSVSLERGYVIDAEKLAEVIAIINRDTDPAATEELIRTEICADWNEGAEHQEWIDTADAEMIADWLASFYQETGVRGIDSAKRFTVISGPRYHPTTQTLQLNGVTPETRFTPRLAIRAAIAAVDSRNRVTVWAEGESYGYRLYANRYRRIKLDV